MYYEPIVARSITIIRAHNITFTDLSAKRQKDQKEGEQTQYLLSIHLILFYTALHYITLAYPALLYLTLLYLTLPYLTLL